MWVAITSLMALRFCRVMKLVLQIISMVALLAGCAVPENTSDWSFRDHPIVWDGETRQLLKGWIGKDVSGPEAVGAIFETRRKTEVLEFARSIKRRVKFNGDFDVPHNPKDEIVRPRDNESYLIIETTNAFETEALAIAMVKSKLFRNIWPVPNAYVQQGSLAGSRREYFHHVANLISSDKTNTDFSYFGAS
jgi:hypothetical protein